MTPIEIKTYLETFQARRPRTIAIVDFSNVEKWKESLGWKIGIGQLSNLIKHFSRGDQGLRRFYYGSDYGPKESSIILHPWSRRILEKAATCGFEVVTKRLKYMPDTRKDGGYEVKCDLDVDMATDLFRMIDLYDTIILFSGDGDLMAAIRFLKERHGKSCIVFGARDHIGREVRDALTEGLIEKILFAEDFENRIRLDRRTGR